MLDAMQNNMLKNFLIILSLFIALVSLGASISIYRQHVILWTDYTFNQFDKKVKSAGAISADIEMYNMCQNQLKTIAVKSNDYALTQIECSKYANYLNIDLYSVLANFDLDSTIRQNISLIQRRNNPDVIDQHTISLANTVLQVLNNQLEQEAKQLGFQS